MAGEVAKNHCRIIRKSKPKAVPNRTAHLICYYAQGPTEINDAYLDRLNYRLQSLMLDGGKNIICSMKTMDKVGETATPE